METQDTYRLEEGATIISQLEKLTKEGPDKPAFVFWDKNLTRSVLTRQNVWDLSRKYAANLRRLGIEKGDIVCNTLVNSRERLITTYGTILAGAVALHGQKLLADGEDITKNWADSKCKAVIINPKEQNNPGVILEKLKYLEEKSENISYKGLPYLTHLISVEFGDHDESWLEELNKQHDTYVEENVKADDKAFVFTTSGSTGFAKLVPHTHSTTLTIYSEANQTLNLKPGDTFYNPRAFGWIGGSPFSYLVSGVTRIAIDLSRGVPDNPGALVIHILNKENCKSAFLIPIDIQVALESLKDGHQLVKPMCSLVTGGSPLTATSMKAIGPIAERIFTSYGSTEAGISFFMEVESPLSYEDSCVGYPAPDVHFKILDDKMEEVAVGAAGEIYIKGPNVVKEYLNNPEESKKTFLTDGWYRTSDIGLLNAKGQLFVFCRKSNAINHKGFIHYPGWMESRINKHPHIQKSYVVGIPDPVSHEDICLCIKQEPGATLTAEVVREFCKSLFLTDDKDLLTPIPKYYLFFESFPHNSNGKIDRKSLKEHARSRIGNGCF